MIRDLGKDKGIRTKILSMIMYYMKKKNIILIIGILLFEILIAGGTMAYWRWENSDDNETLVNFTIDEFFECSADVGGDITPANVQLAPAMCTSEKNAIKKKLTVYTTAYGDQVVLMDLWLEINTLSSELSATQNFKYAITTDENSCTNNVVASGSFTGKQVGDKVYLFNQKNYHESTSEDGEEYWLYIWLDAAETSLSTANKNFKFIINGSCTNEFTE